jgi:hypothetical protein
MSSLFPPTRLFNSISCWKATRDKARGFFFCLFLLLTDRIWYTATGHWASPLLDPTAGLFGKKLCGETAVVTQMALRFLQRNVIVVLFFLPPSTMASLTFLFPPGISLRISLLTGRVYGWAIATTATTLLFFIFLLTESKWNAAPKKQIEEIYSVVFFFF